jgi:hypothetical protein
MTRGDVSTSENETRRTIEVFDYFVKNATIRDDILKRIVEYNYNTPIYEIDGQNDEPNFSIENMKYEI